MLNHYLVLAVKVLLRRKFFTFISLFGISFTLLVLRSSRRCSTTRSAPAPEPRQDRTLYAERAVMYGPHNRWSSSAGFKLLDSYARNLPGVERLSIYRERTDRALVPRRQEDHLVAQADRRRVLADPRLHVPRRRPVRHRRRRRGAVRRGHQRRRRASASSTAAPAVGQTIEADGQRFRVVGVVENVSELRRRPFADIWVPYTTAKTDAYKREIMGDWNAMALARDRRRWPASTKSSTRGCCASSCPIRRATRRSSRRSRPSSRRSPA